MTSSPPVDRLTWIEPGEAGFAAAVAAVPATAAAPPRAPAAVALPSGPESVAEAVRRAAALGLQITVRSGGHGLSGTHLHDGAVVLDLRRLCAVEVLDEHVLRVGPGTVSEHLAGALDRSDRSFPLGHSPRVGAAGFLLAGGNGWAGGDLGAACHRVGAADVVGGDGVLRRIDGADAEALALLRGAGSAMPAVVVGFEVRTEPRAPRIVRTVVDLPPHRAAGLGRMLDQQGAAAGVEHTVMVRAERLTLVETAFGPFRSGVVAALGEPPLFRLSCGGWSELLAGIPDFAGDGQVSDHRWSGTDWQGTLSAAAAAVTSAADRAGRPHQHSSVLVAAAPVQLVGAAEALYSPAGAIGVSVYGHHGPAGRDAARAWVAAVVGGLEEVAVGRYIGEADLSAGRAVLVDCWAPGTLDRLAMLRERVDPDRVIRTAVDR